MEWKKSWSPVQNEWKLASIYWHEDVVEETWVYTGGDDNMDNDPDGKGKGHGKGNDEGKDKGTPHPKVMPPMPSDATYVFEPGKGGKGKCHNTKRTRPDNEQMDRLLTDCRQMTRMLSDIHNACHDLHD